MSRNNNLVRSNYDKYRKYNYTHFGKRTKYNQGFDYYVK